MKNGFLNWLAYSIVGFMVIAVLLFLIGEMEILNKFWYFIIGISMLIGFIVEYRRGKNVISR